MRAGDLRHAISIESKHEQSDGLGGFTSSWEVFAEDIRAAIWPVSAKEIAQNQQLQGQVTHRIRIRYLAGVTSVMRILFGTRYFNILSIVNFEERNIYLDLICMEIA